jgi:hypothetical protein
MISSVDTHAIERGFLVLRLDEALDTVERTRR